MLESRPLDPAAETLFLCAASATMGKVGFCTLGFYTLLLLFSLGCTNPNPHILGFFYFISIGSKLELFSHANLLTPIQKTKIPNVS